MGGGKERGKGEAEEETVGGVEAKEKGGGGRRKKIRMAGNRSFVRPH